LAQTTTVPPAITVQRIAPQLVQFAGSQSNFQNLVAGLTQGTQVQLFTVLPDGATQVVSFTPAPLSADQVAQVLERARQQLIGLGIGNPTGEQLAVALMGGIVPTALGGSQVPGLLATPAPPAAAVQAQTSAAAGATGATTSTTPVPTAPVNVQLLPGTATTATTSPTGTAPLPRINTSDSLLPSGFTSRSPTPPTPVVTAPPSGTGNPTVGAREAAPGAAAGTSAHPRGSASAAAR
jgi:hypothetical protein